MCYKMFFLEVKICLKTKINTKEHNNRQNLTYSLETWILTKRDRKLINIFEGTVYRGILAPVYEMKKEIGEYYPIKKFMQMLNKPTITETIRLNRLRWFGHVQKMGENRIPK